MSDIEINSIPIGAPLYQENQLLASPPPGGAYIIERGKRRAIPNPDTFNARGYDWSQVATLPQDWINQIPAGRDLPDVNWPSTHDNILVRKADGSIFVMKSGKRRYILNFDMPDPDDGDFYYPSDVRNLSDIEIDSIPVGAPLYNDGQLFAGPPPGAVYVIERGKRRAFPNADTFNARGYNWSSIAYLPLDWIEQIPWGRTLPDSSWPDTHDGILLQQTGSVDVWLMKNGFRQRLVSMDTIDPNGDWYYPSDIRLVSSLAGIPVGYIDLPLALSMDRVYWASYADYQAEELSVGFIIKNTGANDASAVTITGSSNTGGVTVISALPMIVGDISAGNQKTATLQYNVPSGVSHFRTSLTAGATDTNRNTHLYP